MAERRIEDPFLHDYFTVLEAFVFMGMRCPGDPDILREFRRFRGDYPEGFTGNPGTTLAKQGFLTIEIAGHNWRTIILHHGPLAGQSTMPCPVSGAPYRILSADREMIRRRLALGVLERKVDSKKKLLRQRTEGIREAIRSLRLLREEIASIEAVLNKRRESGEA